MVDGGYSAVEPRQHFFDAVFKPFLIKFMSGMHSLPERPFLLRSLASRFSQRLNLISSSVCRAGRYSCQARCRQGEFFRPPALRGLCSSTDARLAVLSTTALHRLRDPQTTPPRGRRQRQAAEGQRCERIVLVLVLTLAAAKTDNTPGSARPALSPSPQGCPGRGSCRHRKLCDAVGLLAGSARHRGRPGPARAALQLHSYVG